MVRRVALALWMMGCAPAPAAVQQPLDEAPRLVAVGEATEGPEGGDMRARFTVAFAMPDGSRRAVDREAIAFVERWREGAALVDPERRLYEVLPDGTRRMLARDAVGLAVGGERLAYVVERGGFGSLHVHDGERDTRVAQRFASIGAVRLDGETVTFVGVRPGGIVGVWQLDLGEEPRCLSNCALRTGEPFADRMIPVPTRADDFELTATHVAWTVDGVRHEVAR